MPRTTKTYCEPKIGGTHIIELLQYDPENDTYGGRSTIDVYSTDDKIFILNYTRPIEVSKKITYHTQISVIKEQECRKLIRDFLSLRTLRKDGEEQQEWKIMRGETITYDIWQIDLEGVEFYYCQSCRTQKLDCEQLCKDCEEDRQNGVDVPILRTCDKCGIDVDYNKDCWKFEDDGSFYCYVCANWEEGTKPLLINGTYVSPEPKNEFVSMGAENIVLEVKPKKKIVRRKTPPLTDI